MKVKFAEKKKKRERGEQRMGFGGLNYFVLC